MDKALKEAVDLAGGPESLAEKLGIKRQAVLQWRRCPPLRVIAVEQATGISRERLRPDLYPQDGR